MRGLGFYRQFIDTTEWPSFMRAGRDAALAGLDALAQATPRVTPGHAS